jgi:hypothetical protein
MNRLLQLFLILFCITSCGGKSINPDKYPFKELIKKDISDLSKTISELDTIRKETDWVEGDKLFYNLWLRAAKSELNGEFKTAIKLYNDALEVTRYEMSTYEIKLPLGRALIQNGSFIKAQEILSEFKEEATAEITNDDAEWGLTEEGKESTRKDLEICDELLKLIAK